MSYELFFSPSHLLTFSSSALPRSVPPLTRDDTSILKN
ncbi:hypothetical protein D1AOALGA4SA_8041 [Olavius algarvensis Delta 1 endosymbiont]|nr:hypothetical protein D1AOALGA4SA_8041 [Olavius algarvensis Delta 1 endosymbiont]